MQWQVYGVLKQRIVIIIAHYRVVKVSLNFLCDLSETLSSHFSTAQEKMYMNITQQKFTSGPSKQFAGRPVAAHFSEHARVTCILSTSGNSNKDRPLVIAKNNLQTTDSSPTLD